MSISAFLTAYTANAYYVASYVSEAYGRFWWPNTAAEGRSLFVPWPNIPAGVFGQMITELGEADTQYFLYVIKSGVLVILTVVVWAIVVLAYLKKRKVKGRFLKPSTPHQCWCTAA